MGMLQVLARFISLRVAYLFRKKTSRYASRREVLLVVFEIREGKEGFARLLSEACHEIEAFLCGTLRDFVMRRFPIGVE